VASQVHTSGSIKIRGSNEMTTGPDTSILLECYNLFDILQSCPVRFYAMRLHTGRKLSIGIRRLSTDIHMIYVF
jgi:hypothetical protein